MVLFLKMTTREANERVYFLNLSLFKSVLMFLGKGTVACSLSYHDKIYSSGCNTLLPHILVTLAYVSAEHFYKLCNTAILISERHKRENKFYPSPRKTGKCHGYL